MARARAHAAVTVDAGSPTCRSMGWDAQVTDERAIVTVSCEVDLSDAAMLPVPAGFTVSATGEEVFDTYREGAP